MNILTTDRPARLQALHQNSYFSGLSTEILDDLSLGTYLKHYERGETLFWEGDPCAGLYIMEKGSVKLYKISPQGRELIIKIFEEGATFNEVPVFDGGANPVSAAALEECRAWVVEAGVIRQAMRQHPEMCTAVIKNLTENLRMLVGKVEELSFFQVTNRLARLIRQLPEDQLTGSGPQRVTQDQLAARLGTVREVVARSLRELERSGAIRINRRQIEVLDSETLNDWAQTPYE